jgi:redox-sensitive bicupin YhaK (pirin superfamily)
MIKPRKAEERGRTRTEWLDSRHSFSFADYYDPQNMGFRKLRVINDDRVAAGGGFPTHGHRDMEIISYVLDGQLAHRDSIGTGSVIAPGDVQRMSAGTGIRHSEFNPSKTAGVRFLQIWIEPERTGIEPSYEQKQFAATTDAGPLRLVASRDGRDGSVLLHQDVDIWVVRPGAGERAVHRLAPSRHAWLQVARGSLSINGISLQEGDGAAISGEPAIDIAASQPGTEALLFDLS